MMLTEYRWASETGSHSMPHPDELLYLGYVYHERDGQRVTDPRYPGSVLMRRVLGQMTSEEFVDAAREKDWEG